MAGSIDRRPAAENDLIEIWVCIARENERAADLRSFAIGSRIAFHRPTERGIDLLRVLGGAMDIGPADVA